MQVQAAALLLVLQTSSSSRFAVMTIYVTILVQRVVEHCSFQTRVENREV